MSIIRKTLSEVGIPKTDQEANLHLLQCLASEYEVDTQNPALRTEPDSQHDRGSGTHNVPGVGSE